MAFVLGAAIALAATGWFGGSVAAGPAFDSTAALHTHVLREYGATVASAPAVEPALYQQVLRENRAR